ncbi:MAG: hypothetical protein HY898_29325 [Deltaproteobacteria bacterium]|nr:hypothetical protein [Deltaproteobacteria bacterium]
MVRRTLHVAIAVIVLASCRASQRKALTGDACAKIVVRFEDELAASPNVCNSDLDCACHTSISAEIKPCGGVIDKDTADRLAAIAAEFHRASCFSGVECAKRECAPACVRGHCQ